MVKDKVIVTGFGPFGEHKINASWEAVKLLSSYNIDNTDILIYEIPVVYNDIETKIPQLWEEHRPKLVVHVGVSGLAEIVTIENQANRTGYLKSDCCGLFHPTTEVCTESDGCNVITCSLDTEKICNEINKMYESTVTQISNNAGRYLCEYTYYKSLNIDNKRTVFVHVPTLKYFSAEKLSEIILNIVKLALAQLNCICNANENQENEL